MEHSSETGRRSPTADELTIWRAYVETSEEIGQAMAAGLQATSGISPGDYAVLLALSEADERRLRSSALAEGIGWERSRLSHHLGRMESRGLICRKKSDHDSRGAVVELTDEGARIFRASSAPHLRLIRQLFVEALAPEDLEELGRITGKLRNHLTAEAGTQGGAPASS